MRMFRALGVTVLAVLLAVVGFAASVSSQSADKPIAVTLGEFFIKPDKIEVKAGKVEFEVSNKGGVEHDFHMYDDKDKTVMADGMKKGHGHAAHEAMLLRPGETKKFTYTFKAGKYAIYCMIPAHKEAGMAASLVVK